MTNKIDLNKYSDFVREVTSKESNYMTDFINRVQDVDLKDMEKIGRAHV